MSANAEDDFFHRDIYPPNPKALSDAFDPVHYSHLYAASATSTSSRAFLRSDGAITTLLAPIGSEKLLEIRIDVVQNFPCLRNEGTYSETRNNEYKDWPGMLILTDLRLIFLPYRCRSEKSLRQRFAKLDVEGTGYITVQDLKKSGKSLSSKRPFVQDSDIGEDIEMIDGELINASVTKIRDALEDEQDGSDGAISLEEFLDFMGVNNGDEDNTAVRYGTIMLPIAMLKDIDQSAAGENFGDAPVADDKNLELIQVSIPKYEDVTQSFDKFDLAKFYKFDYKFEDYKFEYRVYIIHVEFGRESEIKWTVHRRYSAFESLYAALAARLPYLQLPDLPPKTPTMNEWPIFSSNGYQAFLQKRQEDLEVFLQHLVRLQEVWDQGCLLQRFLDSSDDFENFERANEYLAKRAQQGGVLVTDRTEKEDRSQQQPIDGYAAVAAVQLAVATAASMKDSYRMIEVTPVDDDDDDEKGTDDVMPFDKEEDAFGFSSDSRKLSRRRSVMGKNRKTREVREILDISTLDGRSFVFHVGRSADASLVETRYGCNGLLNNKEWCQRLKKRVKWMTEEDEFKNVLSRSPSLHNSTFSYSSTENDDINAVEKCNGLKGDFSLLAEYCRIGVPNDIWTISDVNANYETIPSYPRILILPANFVDMGADTLMSVVNQRSSGRIPVLTWLHPVTRAPLCRSSQPMSGLGSVLTEDDILLKSIHSVTSSHSGNKVLRIVDARPKLNARANSYMGKGYEDVSRLGQDFQIHFLGIENIHRMRQSLELISEAVTHGGDASSGSPSFDSLLVQSNWLYHGRQIMLGALFIASCLEGGDPVLVHCSDGWDRTSQLCALAQLLLDPFYRTIVGFKALIEKEFCSFGHPFESRSHSYNKDDHSPIFIQFLDIVWHITDQFPTAFEFNQQYLIILADAVYSRCFTTFLGDSERERMDIKAVVKKTVVGDIAVVTTIADALNVFNIEADPWDSDSESVDHMEKKGPTTSASVNGRGVGDNLGVDGTAHDGDFYSNDTESESKEGIEGRKYEYNSGNQDESHSVNPHERQKSSTSLSIDSSANSEGKPANAPLTFSLWDYLDMFFDVTTIKNELYKTESEFCSSRSVDCDKRNSRGSKSSGYGEVNVTGSQTKEVKLTTNTNIFNRGLKPSVDPRVWKFWDSYFLRGSSVNLQRFQNNSRGCNHYAHQFMYMEHDKALRSQIDELKKRVKDKE